MSIKWMCGPFLRIGQLTKLHLQIHWRFKDYRVPVSFLSIHFGTMKRGLFITFYRHGIEEGYHRNHYYKRLYPTT